MTKTKGRKIVECGMVVGTGESVSEAKADLQRQLTAACTGSDQPILLTAGRYMAVVYREPNGWGYRMTFLDDVVKPGVYEIGYGHPHATKDEAIQQAAYHVLDLGSPEDGYHDDSEIPKMLTDPEKRRSLLSNGRFRRAYAYAKANQPDGATNDHLWHSWACHHSSDPQFA